MAKHADNLNIVMGVIIYLFHFYYVVIETDKNTQIFDTIGNYSFLYLRARSKINEMTLSMEKNF